MRDYLEGTIFRHSNFLFLFLELQEWVHVVFLLGTVIILDESFTTVLFWFFTTGLAGSKAALYRVPALARHTILFRSQLLFWDVFTHDGVLKLIDQTRIGNQVIESGKIELDLPLEACCHEDVLGLVFANENQELLSEVGVLVDVIQHLNQHHYV